jgi:hypothetical protein
MNAYGGVRMSDNYDAEILNEFRQHLSDSFNKISEWPEWKRRALSPFRVSSNSCNDQTEADDCAHNLEETDSKK